MPFKFAWFCELLDELEAAKPEYRTTQARQFDPSNRIVSTWLQRYSDRITRHGHSAVAFLSALFPERRPDRTYNLQEKRLTQLVGRVLGLGATRLRLLKAYEKSNGPDFATCVEKVMQETELSPRRHDTVTLEEIDLALTEVAASAISSAPHIRAQATERPAWVVLGPILRRLRSSEAKWVVRMIHKSYAPVEIPEYVALHGFHFMLPKLLKIQNSLEAATKLLARPEIARLPPRPAKEFELALMPFMFKEILPEVGTMIRRQPLEKARSVNHCVKLSDNRVMSIERKYDGEYCQIHIEVRRHDHKIQIFSKSGRDSTQDRAALLECIRIGLGLGTAECKIRGQAILEGELVAYSTARQLILPFYHVRKHVLHGGRRIGTALDSPKRSGEQLMIVFFDVLLLDQKALINEPHRRRRQYLKAFVNTVEGTSRVVERAIIDFSHKKARSALRAAFGSSIRKRWEGFVLKGLEDPYFSWKQNARSIKFKKDYIAGLGDTADLCVVGGGRDARVEAELDIGALRWTFFYVACILNKEEVRRHGARPHFRIIDRIGPGSMSKADIVELNIEARLVDHDFAASSPFMLIEQPRKDFPQPTSMFTKPMIVEIMGAGFERPQTVDFFVIRFPRRIGSKIKIHTDRDIADTVDFNELQEMAEKSTYEQIEAASQEEIEWIQRLEAADPKPQYAMENTQSTISTKTPQSAATTTLSATLSIRASTQPSPTLVRTASEELTPPECQIRYPDSAPQTPARCPESTASPVTTRRSTASFTSTKRRLSLQEDSPMYQVANKKSRVAFDTKVSTAQIPEHGPLIDVTNTYGTTIAKQKSTNRVEANTKVKKQITNNRKSTSSPTNMVHGLPTPASTAENIHNSDEVQVLQSCIRSSMPLNSVKSTRGYANIDPQEVLAYLLKTPYPLSCHAEVHGPVWVAPSVLSRAGADCSSKTEPEEGELLYSSKKENMLESMISIEKSDETPRYKFLTILDTSKPELAVRDLKELCDMILSFAKSDIETMRRSEILLFDYKVLGSQISYTSFDFQHSEFEEHLASAEQWFYGILEINKGSDAAQTGREGFRIGINWDITLNEAIKRGVEIGF